MDLLKRIGLWMSGHSADFIFGVGLALLAIGCGLKDPSLGLIVPGAIIVGLTAIMHLIAFWRGGST